MMGKKSCCGKEAPLRSESEVNGRDKNDLSHGELNEDPFRTGFRETMPPRSQFKQSPWQKTSSQLEPEMIILLRGEMSSGLISLTASPAAAISPSQLTPVMK